MQETEMRRASMGEKESEARKGHSSSHGQAQVFRPFQMREMENVSILFADIAGFTRMAANKSADELVDLLNDLFGRFDRLAK